MECEMVGKKPRKRIIRIRRKKGGEATPPSEFEVARDKRERGSTERYPIVFVPGWASPTVHSAYFRNRLKLEGFEVSAIRFAYRGTGDVVKSAEILSGEVQKALHEFSSEKVNIVSHSLGGVITRYYLQKLGGWRHAHRAVYLSTPHKGVLWAYLGLWTKAGWQLLPDSKVMKGLNSDPSRCTNIKCLSITSSTDEMLIPRGTGILDCAYNIKVHWPVGHWGLMFSNRIAGWIADFFDGLFDIRQGFAKVYEQRSEACEIAEEDTG